MTRILPLKVYRFTLMLPPFHQLTPSCFFASRLDVFKAVKPISVISHNLGSTTDELATSPFNFVLFSAAQVELAKFIPVRSLILSSHLFFCLPFVLFPFTVPCRIVFAKPEDLETWPNHLSFHFLIRINGCLDLSANLLIGNTLLVQNVQ